MIYSSAFLLCRSAMNMYYNRSCRGCGTHLTPTSLCNMCLEHVSWICSKCLKIDDVTHKHSNCEISYIDAVTKTINSYFSLCLWQTLPASIILSSSNKENCPAKLM